MFEVYKYATNWCNGFPLLLENKWDLDIFVTYNCFALKYHFDCWRKTIVSALENRCVQWNTGNSTKQPIASLSWSRVEVREGWSKIATLWLEFALYYCDQGKVLIYRRRTNIAYFAFPSNQLRHTRLDDINYCLPLHLFTPSFFDI